MPLEQGPVRTCHLLVALTYTAFALVAFVDGYRAVPEVRDCGLSFSSSRVRLNPSPCLSAWRAALTGMSSSRWL